MGLTLSSVQLLSRVRLFMTPWIAARQASPCPSPTPRVHSNSYLSSWWCHPAISSSVVPFSSCPQSLPASESFPMSQLFACGGQSIGVSALTSSHSNTCWMTFGWMHIGLIFCNYVDLLYIYLWCPISQDNQCQFLSHFFYIHFLSALLKMNFKINGG